jgi:cytochrome c biogenesis protein CcmG, thiol:disulfide interchange protein DsbE
MKSFLLFLLLGCFTEWLAAQNFFSDTELRNVDGKIVKSSEIFNHNLPVVLIFWKSYDTKCCDNLENMQSAWISRLKESGVNLVAVCIDCRGSYCYVKPLIQGKAWEFDIYIDTNGDFKRALGVTDAPYTLLFDKNQKLICRYQGYCSGNEDMVCEKILHCLSESNSDLIVQAECYLLKE